ncbi:hypothetical protein GCM10022415_33990 [Knoellia locipacati]|uniref:Uncharacterized protein n=1 Tax=Knoellia locipacati TaxID=882824 RepID=A0A512T586_9MICO|nr:hypothetical protein [Knoellia locipacati]GEQ15345.1 hypothetical protein KLO01_33920 [Knoellia locipacati]
MALVAFGDSSGDQGDVDVSEEVVIPRPPSEVIILAGRRRGEESLDMLISLFTRVRGAHREQTRELAPGPSLEDLDKNYKGNAAHLVAHIVGSGVETLVEQSQDADRVLDSVAQLLEQLSG